LIFIPPTYYLRMVVSTFKSLDGKTERCQSPAPKTTARVQNCTCLCRNTEFLNATNLGVRCTGRILIMAFLENKEGE